MTNFIIIFTQDMSREMVPGDTPEREVRDSKVCCKHLLGKGLLLWFHFVGGGGVLQDIHVRKHEAASPACSLVMTSQELSCMLS